MATEIGIKALRDALSRYVDEVRVSGRQLIVTDRGRPVAKLVPLDPWDERYARLIADGAITPATALRRPFPRPTATISPGPTLAEIVVEQRG